MSKTFKYVSSILIFLNLFSAVFWLIVAISGIGNVATNIIGVIAYIVMCGNVVYSIFNNKTGYIQIIATALLYFVNLIGNYITGLSLFSLSVSIIGIIAIICLYLINILLIVLGLKDRGIKIELSERLRKILSLIGICVSVIVMIVLLAVSVISTWFAGVSEINTNTVNMAMFLIFISITITVIFIKIMSMDKHGIRKTASLLSFILIFCVTVTSFAVTEGTAYKDNKAARQSFVEAFGKDALETKGGMVNMGYDFAKEFTGTVTKGYNVKKDILYYAPTDGVWAGMKLRYDVYYPSDGTSKGVLLNLHGSGGDKDIGNYAHRNKYFASRGYTVFDIQFGDFNEKGVFLSQKRTAESMLYNINEFFKYAVKNNDVNADFSNTFITGVSMGGTLASKYAYSYSNSLKANNIELKGILPIYPGYSPDDTGMDNFLNYIDKDSVPCLVSMSMSDCVVDPKAVDYYLDAFERAGNPYCAAVRISFAGHGCDSLASGRSNQLITYYAERFMEHLRD